MKLVSLVLIAISFTAIILSLIIPSLTHAQSPNVTLDRTYNITYNGSTYPIRYHHLEGGNNILLMDITNNISPLLPNQTILNIMINPSTRWIHDTLIIELPTNLTSKNSDVKFSVYQNYNYGQKIPFKEEISKNPTARLLAIDVKYGLIPDQEHYKEIHIAIPSKER
jgi:hypothetical protein